MPRFAANLGFLFCELPLEERFAAAAKAGFKGVEIAFPYHLTAERVGDLVAMNGLELALINAPPGDWAAGERGLAAVPGRRQEFMENMEVAYDWAEFLDLKRVHVMAGIVPEADWEEALETYLENLARAADLFSDLDTVLTVEAINTQDMPDYFLSRPEDAARVVEMVGARNLRIQYDLYHAQIMQGGLSDFLDSHIEHIAHVQIAGVPGRHEPDRLGEVNWPYLFGLLDSHGYGGWVGCEYHPRGDTRTGLAWGRDWGLG
ncbi:2-oxo-tetronate isomerase [Roseospirillum parvum]|uniref:Hydroxypyruvate isomerase n=1 Tax=Roseospirillum parvum TaxID=83401 RepID=A0A1G7ZKY2_9PROT|nr:2-oxo-tetronate isomerase [Roseospirillum parvum]SDH09344.1 hydroxypyruvate isomerase [Roseospirillum parvum]